MVKCVWCKKALFDMNRAKDKMNEIYTDLVNFVVGISRNAGSDFDTLLTKDNEESREATIKALFTDLSKNQKYKGALVFGKNNLGEIDMFEAMMNVLKAAKTTGVSDTKVDHFGTEEGMVLLLRTASQLDWLLKLHDKGPAIPFVTGAGVIPYNYAAVEDILYTSANDMFGPYCLGKLKSIFPNPTETEKRNCVFTEDDYLSVWTRADEILKGSSSIEMTWLIRYANSIRQTVGAESDALAKSARLLAYQGPILAGEYTLYKACAWLLSLGGAGAGLGGAGAGAYQASQYISHIGTKAPTVGYRLVRLGNTLYAVSKGWQKWQMLKVIGNTFGEMYSSGAQPTDRQIQHLKEAVKNGIIRKIAEKGMDLVVDLDGSGLRGCN